MKATINHGPCACNCGELIVPRSDFVIRKGLFFLLGHDRDALEESGIEVKRDYSRMTLRPVKEQKAITELPMFKTEHHQQEELAL